MRTRSGLPLLSARGHGAAKGYCWTPYGVRRLCPPLRPTPIDSELLLAAVTQSCGYAVDSQMDCVDHALIHIAGPVTLQQLDLDMVERIKVGKAVLDRARQQGISGRAMLAGR